MLGPRHGPPWENLMNFGKTTAASDTYESGDLFRESREGFRLSNSSRRGSKRHGEPAPRDLVQCVQFQFVKVRSFDLPLTAVAVEAVHLRLGEVTGATGRCSKQVSPARASHGRPDDARHPRDGRTDRRQAGTRLRCKHTERLRPAPHEGRGRPAHPCHSRNELCGTSGNDVDPRHARRPCRCRSTRPDPDAGPGRARTALPLQGTDIAASASRPGMEDG